MFTIILLFLFCNFSLAAEPKLVSKLNSAFSEISTVPLDLRKKMEEKIKILSFDVEKVLVARDKQSVKALFRLIDGSLMESVLISPKPNNWSVCISCQVGCAMGCRFCATGKMGFKRNLTAEEITDQVLFWRQYLEQQAKVDGQQVKRKNVCPMPHINDVVYMGMGEPFLNWNQVAESIKILTDNKLFGFGSRSLSVSTCGIAEGIEKMAQKFPQVNLAVSLHFAGDEKRNQNMPVNKKNNLESIKNALKKYFYVTKRKVFLEYIMLENINDTKKDAKMLADYIRSIGSSHLLHVNLIRYNMTSENFKPSSKNKTHLFKNELLKMGIGVTIRKSLGEEIQGACGQLAGKN
jgi:adenine C2-methylase RlmN of 23S rRNA A2503 and tRNA A37